MMPVDDSAGRLSSAHLGEEEVLAVARAAEPLPAPGAAGLTVDRLPRQSAHLSTCGSCQARVLAARRLTTAARAADLAGIGSIVVPSFESLLAGRLSPRRAGVDSAMPTRGESRAPGQVPASVVAPPLAGIMGAAGLRSVPSARQRPALRVAAALAVGIVWRQARLIPRSLAALVCCGLALAVLAARAVPDPDWGQALFVSAVVLTVAVSALCTCVWTHDPRRELMFALPVSPAVVLAARLVVVLAADLALALTASVALTLAGGTAMVGALVSAWLGPSLLAAGICVVVAVWLSPWAGGLAGIAAWGVGSVATLPRTSSTAGGLAGQLWSTSTVTLGTAVLLLAVAVRLTANAERNLDGT